jgi:glycosyltransferase involved in cell wall biosynthesis
MAEDRRYKIVYCTPALYMAGGVERVLTLKANYFAEHYGYDITIILTEGKDKPFFYPLSDKINVLNLDVNFEELWTCSFIKKVIVYLKKQRLFKRLLTSELMRIRPDMTISLLRREINFLTSIKDGSRKIGELHVNRANYRNFEGNESNVIKNLFAKLWMKNLVGHLRKLDKFVVLTEEDKSQWHELSNIEVIPDPLSFHTDTVSPLTSKRVIAVGRYVYQKGFDLLLEAWSIVEKQCRDWELAIYGQGERDRYEQLMDELKINRNRCHLNGATSDIKQEYLNSSVFAFSSRFEGFGMVLIEAMSCGLPVVSFDCPCGPKDIISNNTDGILVPNGDVEKLADSLLYFINHVEEIRHFSINAQVKSKQYSLDVLSLRWINLFDTLME